MSTKIKKKGSLVQHSIFSFHCPGVSKVDNDKSKLQQSKNISRQNSVLSATDNDDGFGDDSSYDTSIDASMEILNFRDPTLESVLLQHRANQPLTSQRNPRILGESNLINAGQCKPDSLKRSNSDILSTFDGGAS